MKWPFFLGGQCSLDQILVYYQTQSQFANSSVGEVGVFGWMYEYFFFLIDNCSLKFLLKKMTNIGAFYVIS